MFLANLTRREKLLLYLTAAVISLSLIYNFALKPLGVKWNRLNRQVLNKEIELKRNIKYLKQEQNVRSIYQKYAGHIQEKGSQEEEITSLLNEVEKKARAAGIHIANIRPKPIKDLVFCKKYILEMNCEATMEKYIEFIYNLQKSRQLIKVEKLKLTSQGKDSPSLKAQMFITRILAVQ